jgi:hypothetical protein
MSNGQRLAMRLTTRTRLADEQGDDFDEILAELAEEKELAASYGIELVDVIKPPNATEVSADDDGAGDASETGDGGGDGTKPKGGKEGWRR